MAIFNIYADAPKGALPLIENNPKLNDETLYVPSKGLIGALNVALQLNQPLLLTGEPGTGKTQFAHHIAAHFGLDKPLVFNAQTTSQAKDLFYRYDALAHFQFAQTQRDTLLTDELVEQKFIHYQGLSKAIKEGKRAVVLLDEIDKAPRDFPNDILAALEDLTFTVSEVGKTFKVGATHRPIIIMTSNSEKNLPDAFLRRVAYHHILFPSDTELLRIVSSKIDGYNEAELTALIAHFAAIRSGKMVKMSKNPATAELIHWIFLLKKARFPAAKIADLSDLNKSERDLLTQSYAVLAKNRNDLQNLQKILRG